MGPFVKRAIPMLVLAGVLLWPAGGLPLQAQVDDDVEIYPNVSSEMEEFGDMEEPAGLDKKIFLDLRDINVVDILKFLAIQGGLNIVTSKNVQGRSTLVLRNVKIQDALDIIVISNQLAYEIKNDIIYVMTEDEYVQQYGKSFNDKRRIMTTSLKYVKPSYVASVLEAAQSAIGKVIIDEETGTVIVIDVPEKLDEMRLLLSDMERKLKTAVVELQYADAKQVEAQLKLQVDAKSVGTVFADERSNQVVVSAYPERLDEVVQLVKSLDKQTPGILLEVRILQLTLNPKYDFGVDWEKAFLKETNNTALRNLNFAGSFPIDSAISPAAFAPVGSNIGTVGKIGIGELTADDFQIEVKALKEVQNTKVLANPRIMVLNREEARINIGDRIPYVITTTTGTGNNTSVSEEIKFIDVGLSLIVTPVINEDGFITIKIRPEISSQINTLVTPTNNRIPIVNTTFVESTVIVKDGVSVVLGGLIRDDFNETNQGIPVLMDIPVVGQMFQNRNEEYQKSEIAIIITPKIVNGSRDVLDEPIEIKGSGLWKRAETLKGNGPAMPRDADAGLPVSAAAEGESALSPKGIWPDQKLSAMGSAKP